MSKLFRQFRQAPLKNLKNPLHNVDFNAKMEKRAVICIAFASSAPCNESLIKKTRLGANFWLVAHERKRV
jgi:hypothetical protein